jgi:sucrose phosphorylase
MEKPDFTTILAFLYGRETAESLVPRLMDIIEKNKPRSAGPASEKKAPRVPQKPFTHKDAFLISYGNMLSGAENAETGLARLFRFLEKRNHGAFSYLHILPFHPYSSDDGFSVIDYRRVDDRFGTWEDIERFKTLPAGEGNPAGSGSPACGGSLNLAFDFVVNHGSVQSEWFTAFLQNKEPHRSWYIIRPADYNYSAVVRPRTHPLLTEFTRDGEPVWVWTTFSADQVDYDFSNPQVLLEFVTILLDYARRGAGIVRLDAVAYLWKEDGTPCLHHPKTHGVVKLFRGIVDYLGLPLLILTETNVPHNENISYFGSPVGDGALDSLPEAHMVYNFALPPLALYAAISGDAGPLRAWAKTLDGTPPGGYFLNFLASHDGVGLTPARGLVDEGAFTAVLEEARRRGALISYKSTPQGEIPYELNCSYASIVAPPDLGSVEVRARAFMAVHGVLLSLSGLPALYFHSWIGSEAWTEGPALLGYNRAINREKPALDTVEKELDDPASFRFHVHRLINAFLAFRQKEAVFDPDVPQQVLETDSQLPCSKGLFALLRGPADGGRRALCIENLSSTQAEWKAGELPETIPPEWKTITLEPWETRWLVWDKNGAAVISSV